MKTKRYSEATILSGARLDREEGVIHGVKILGTRSKNGRIYPIEMLREKAGLYEGAKVYFDHTNQDNPTHSVLTLFGYLEGVSCEADGLYSDLVYNTKHECAEQILWQIEKAPDKIGLSPHHEGISETLPDGTLLITEITRVLSVDIVDNPATNDGMFESENEENGGTKMDWESITLDDLIENQPDLVKEIQVDIAEKINAQNEILTNRISEEPDEDDGEFEEEGDEEDDEDEEEKDRKEC